MSMAEANFKSASRRFLEKWRCRTAACVRIASWTMLALLVALAAAIRWAGDSTWVMTAIVFGPRWVVLLPLAPLAAGALIFCRRALWPLVLAAFCGLGPVMGLCVPWRSLAFIEPDGALVLRIVTFNVGSGIDSAGMIDFLRKSRADVIAFQEWPGRLSFPEQIERGWFSAQKGELMIASRYPIVDFDTSTKATGRWNAPAIRCDLETPAGIVHVHCLHLYTLRKGLDAVISGKWKGAPELRRVTAIRNEESEIVRDFAAERDGPSLVVGDFNMTCDSTVFDRDWGHWQDAFSLAGFGLGHSFASRRIGLRIDHILADATRWHIRSCQVGPDLKGQHRPVVAELVLVGSE